MLWVVRLNSKPSNHHEYLAQLILNFTSMNSLKALPFLLLFTACNNPENIPKQTDSVSRKTDTLTVAATLPKLRRVGREVQGDFNGDGQIDSAIEVVVKEPNGNPVEDGVAGAFAIRFLSGKLPSVQVGCCHFRLINEGDLNGDGRDDLSIFQAPENGCTYRMATYSFRNRTWKQLMEPFLIPTACEPFGDEALQQRIFKEQDTVYFYETDANDVHSKLIKKKAVLK